MAIEAKAKVQVQGGSEALKTIQGLQRATKQAGSEATKAAREQERAATKAAREQQRVHREAERLAKNASRATDKAARDAASAAKKQADAQIREAKRADKELERIQNSEARRWRKLAEESRRVREQAEERTKRSRERQSSTVTRRTAGFVGAATAGALAGGAVAASTARGITGVQDVGERVRNANQMREQLIVTASAAHMSREESKSMLGNVMSTSEKKVVDQADLIDGLRYAHETFNALKFVNEHLEELAGISKATGTDFTQLVGQVGSMRNAFGEEGIMEELYRSLGMSESGSLSAANFAGPMSAAMGSFANQTGMRSAKGSQVFNAMMQTIAGAGYDAEATETRGTQFVNSLNKKEIADVLTKKHGIKYTPGDFDPFDVAYQISKSPTLQSPLQVASVFHDQQAREGLNAIIGQTDKVTSSFRPWKPNGDAGVVGELSMMSIAPDAGRAAINDVTSRLQDAGVLDLQREAIAMQNHTIENLNLYNEQILSVTRATNNLEKSFGTLSLWLPSIAAAGGTSLLAGAMGGAAGGVGGGAAGGGGGAGGGGLLIGGFSPGAVGALTGAFAAGYGVATALGADTAWEDADKYYNGDTSSTSRDVGSRPSTWLTDTVDSVMADIADRVGLLDGVNVEKLDRSKPGASSGADKSAPVVAELRTQNKLLSKLVEQGDRRPPPPINQPARSPR